MTMQAATALYWPRDLPREIAAPATSIHANLEIAALRYPGRPAIHFFGRDLAYAQVLDEVRRLSGWMASRCGIARGDRVAIHLQNSPQWLIGYYAILRIGAIAVPINPMNRAQEIAHYLRDSGAKLVISAQDLLPQLRQGAQDSAVQTVLLATYGDYLPAELPAGVPDWISEVRREETGVVAWRDALEDNHDVDVAEVGPQDPCGIFYTSGSTGVAKGCLLSHGAFMHNIVGQALWHWTAPGTAALATSPMFHVSGLNHGVHMPVYVGGTSVILPRWDRDWALRLIESQKIGHATIPPTALADLMESPLLGKTDVSSFRRLTAGGAAMPRVLAARVKEALGVDFIEAYGLTETAATTHLNPVMRPKLQSLGIPYFNTRSMVVDPDTLQPLKQGETGEILISGPQLFTEYWQRPEETAKAFVTIDGHRWFRSGDIGHVDEEGYFFMTDRAKRMINASGYKVWPAEVEKLLYQHESIKEVCVVSSRDAHRGETVKAYVVTHPGHRLGEAELIEWSKQRLSAYKYPRRVQFVEALPKSNVGKILWREVQDAENAAAQTSS